MIKGRSWLGCAALITVALFLGFAFWPVGHGGYEPAPNSQCLSNVKQLSLALSLYTLDYEAYPPERWAEIINPYAKKPEIFRCPVVKEGSGYAFNANLLGRKSQPDEKVAMLFESNDLARGATAKRLDSLDPRRHKDRMMMGFADGHAKSVPFRDLLAIKMNFEDPRKAGETGTGASTK